MNMTTGERDKLYSIAESVARIEERIGNITEHYSSRDSVIDMIESHRSNCLNMLNNKKSVLSIKNVTFFGTLIGTSIYTLISLITQ